MSAPIAGRRRGQVNASEQGTSLLFPSSGTGGGGGGETDGLDWLNVGGSTAGNSGGGIMGGTAARSDGISSAASATAPADHNPTYNFLSSFNPSTAPTAERRSEQPGGGGASNRGGTQPNEVAPMSGGGAQTPSPTVDFLDFLDADPAPAVPQGRGARAPPESGPTGNNGAGAAGSSTAGLMGENGLIPPFLSSSNDGGGLPWDISDTPASVVPTSRSGAAPPASSPGASFPFGMGRGGQPATINNTAIMSSFALEQEQKEKKALLEEFEELKREEAKVRESVEKLEKGSHEECSILKGLTTEMDKYKEELSHAESRLEALRASQQGEEREQSLSALTADKERETVAVVQALTAQLGATKAKLEEGVQQQTKATEVQRRLVEEMTARVAAGPHTAVMTKLESRLQELMREMRSDFCFSVKPLLARVVREQSNDIHHARTQDLAASARRRWEALLAFRDAQHTAREVFKKEQAEQNKQKMDRIWASVQQQWEKERKYREERATTELAAFQSTLYDTSRQQLAVLEHSLKSHLDHSREGFRALERRQKSELQRWREKLQRELGVFKQRTQAERRSFISSRLDRKGGESHPLHPLRTSSSLAEDKTSGEGVGGSRSPRKEGVGILFSSRRMNGGDITATVQLMEGQLRRLLDVINVQRQALWQRSGGKLQPHGGRGGVGMMVGAPFRTPAPFSSSSSPFFPSSTPVLKHSLGETSAPLHTTTATTATETGEIEQNEEDRWRRWWRDVGYAGGGGGKSKIEQERWGERLRLFQEKKNKVEALFHSLSNQTTPRLEEAKDILAKRISSIKEHIQAMEQQTKEKYKTLVSLRASTEELQKCWQRTAREQLSRVGGYNDDEGVSGSGNGKGGYSGEVRPFSPSSAGLAIPDALRVSLIRRVSERAESVVRCQQQLRHLRQQLVCLVGGEVGQLDVHLSHMVSHVQGILALYEYLRGVEGHAQSSAALTSAAKQEYMVAKSAITMEIKEMEEMENEIKKSLSSILSRRKRRMMRRSGSSSSSSHNAQNNPEQCVNADKVGREKEEGKLQNGEVNREEERDLLSMACYQHLLLGIQKWKYNAMRGLEDERIEEEEGKRKNAVYKPEEKTEKKKKCVDRASRSGSGGTGPASIRVEAASAAVRQYPDGRWTTTSPFEGQERISTLEKEEEEGKGKQGVREEDHHKPPPPPPFLLSSSASSLSLAPPVSFPVPTIQEGRLSSHPHHTLVTPTTITHAPSPGSLARTSSKAFRDCGTQVGTPTPAEAFHRHNHYSPHSSVLHLPPAPSVAVPAAILPVELQGKPEVKDRKARGGEGSGGNVTALHTPSISPISLSVEEPQRLSGEDLFAAFSSSSSSSSLAIREKMSRQTSPNRRTSSEVGPSKTEEEIKRKKNKEQKNREEEDEQVIAAGEGKKRTARAAVMAIGIPENVRIANFEKSPSGGKEKFGGEEEKEEKKNEYPGITTTTTLPLPPPSSSSVYSLPSSCPSSSSQEGYTNKRTVHTPRGRRRTERDDASAIMTIALPSSLSHPHHHHEELPSPHSHSHEIRKAERSCSSGEEGTQERGTDKSGHGEGGRISGGGEGGGRGGKYKGTPEGAQDPHSISHPMENYRDSSLFPSTAGEARGQRLEMRGSSGSSTSDGLGRRTASSEISPSLFSRSISTSSSSSSPFYFSTSSSSSLPTRVTWNSQDKRFERVLIPPRDISHVYPFKVGSQKRRESKEKQEEEEKERKRQKRRTTLEDEKNEWTEEEKEEEEANEENTLHEMYRRSPPYTVTTSRPSHPPPSSSSLLLSSPLRGEIRDAEVVGKKGTRKNIIVNEQNKKNEEGKYENSKRENEEDEEKEKEDEDHRHHHRHDHPTEDTLLLPPPPPPLPHHRPTFLSSRWSSDSSISSSLPSSSQLDLLMTALPSPSLLRRFTLSHSHSSSSPSPSPYRSSSFFPFYPSVSAPPRYPLPPYSFFSSVGGGNGAMGRLSGMTGSGEEEEDNGERWRRVEPLPASPVGVLPPFLPSWSFSLSSLSPPAPRPSIPSKTGTTFSTSSFASLSSSSSSSGAPPPPSGAGAVGGVLPPPPPSAKATSSITSQFSLYSASSRLPKKRKRIPAVEEEDTDDDDDDEGEDEDKQPHKSRQVSHSCCMPSREPHHDQRQEHEHHSNHDSNNNPTCTTHTSTTTTTAMRSEEQEEGSVTVTMTNSRSTNRSSSTGSSSELDHHHHHAVYRGDGRGAPYFFVHPRGRHTIIAPRHPGPPSPSTLPFPHLHHQHEQKSSDYDDDNNYGPDTAPPPSHPALHVHWMTGNGEEEDGEEEEASHAVLSLRRAETRHEYQQALTAALADKDTSTFSFSSSDDGNDEEEETLPRQTRRNRTANGSNGNSEKKERDTGRGGRKRNNVSLLIPTHSPLLSPPSAFPSSSHRSKQREGKQRTPADGSFMRKASLTIPTPKERFCEDIPPRLPHQEDEEEEEERELISRTLLPSTESSSMESGSEKGADGSDLATTFTTPSPNTTATTTRTTTGTTSMNTTIIPSSSSSTLHEEEETAVHTPQRRGSGEEGDDGPRPVLPAAAASPMGSVTPTTRYQQQQPQLVHGVFSTSLPEVSSERRYDGMAKERNHDRMKYENIDEESSGEVGEEGERKEESLQDYVRKGIIKGKDDDEDEEAVRSTSPSHSVPQVDVTGLYKPSSSYTSTPSSSPTTSTTATTTTTTTSTKTAGSHSK